MTVVEMLAAILKAYPGANPDALGVFRPVFFARFGKREGPQLQAAFEATLVEFKPKYGQPFPIPGDFERHMPSARLDLGKGDVQKLDLAGRKSRADSLFANWRAGQGTRAAKGNPALMRALENVAQQIANTMAWSDNPEPLVLTRDQLKLAAQRAISFERLLRHGQPPRDRMRWWDQISAIATEWQIQITPDWWDAETGKAIANPEASVSRVERFSASKVPASAGPSIPINVDAQAALAAAVARKHREQGRIEYAEILERRAGVVPASDEPPPFDGVPEAMEVA